MDGFEERAQSIMDEILLKMRDHFKCGENYIKMHDLEIRPNDDLSFKFETHLIKVGTESNELRYKENIFLEMKRSRKEVIFFNEKPYKYPKDVTELFEAIRLHLDHRRNIYAQRR